MKTKIILISILAFILTLGLFLALDYGSVLWEGFISPKRQDVRRKVFKKTRSFIEAKTQDLVKYRLEYLRTKTKVEKKALKETILFMFADFNEDLLPDTLKNFLKKMKYEGVN